MTNEEVTKNIWLNSISNYINIFLRIVLGLFLFRLLYQGLPREEFGFWALLWSVFGFGIVFDFGFGFAAVKKVAELSVHGRWDELSRVLSTILFFYLAIGVFLIAVVVGGSHYLIDFFNVTAGNREPFREILIYFFVGLAIAFPLGIFPEILIGQQRIALTNLLFCSGAVANFVLIYLAMRLHWGLRRMVVISLLTAIIPCLISAVCAMRRLPRVQLHPRLFSFAMIRETMSFSLYAYVGTLSNMILGKTDQLVISSTLSVAMVAIYQAGAKIGEMFGAFTTQLPETFSPAAAHLHAKGDKAFLRKLLIDGTRFSVMIATPAYFIGACYMEGLLKILTGDKVVPRETFWVGQILLLWQYTTVITQSVTKRIFMMCGHEKRLMKLGLGEAMLNLFLSLAFVLYFRNVVGVALGSLIATFFYGWFTIWPWAAREVNLSGWRLAETVLLPIWSACLPLIAFVLVLRVVPWLDFKSSTLIFLVECAIAAVVGALCLWYRALTREERGHLTVKLGRFIPRQFRGTTA